MPAGIYCVCTNVRLIQKFILECQWSSQNNYFAKTKSEDLHLIPPVPLKSLCPTCFPCILFPWTFSWLPLTLPSGLCTNVTSSKTLFSGWPDLKYSPHLIVLFLTLVYLSAKHITTWHFSILYIYLLAVWFVQSLYWNESATRTGTCPFPVLFLLLYSQGLKQCLAYSKHSVSICWIR